MVDRNRPSVHSGPAATAGATAGAEARRVISASNQAAGARPPPPPPPPPPRRAPAQPQVTPLGPPPPPRSLFGKRDDVFKPWPLPSKQPSNIAEFVQRLQYQGIDFRDLNEDTLRAQIEEKKTEDEAGKQNDSEKPKESAATGAKLDTTKDQSRGQQEVFAKHDVIMTSLEAAIQNGLIAVDFVSLLLSKDRPTQALQTLSPVVREKAGIGTLSAGRVANVAQAARAIQSQLNGGISGGKRFRGELTADEEQALDETTRYNAQRLIENKLECVGWQLLAMDQASEALDVTHKQLRAEMRREERYWAEVLAVRDKGWTLSRVPGQQRMLRVKVGFSESAPDLKARSFAPLRRIKNGQVALDLTDLGTPSAVVVTLKKIGLGGQETIGRSPLATRLSDAAPLESRLFEARNTVYAQELWHELCREARTMIAHDVVFRDNAIAFPAGADTKGIISLEPLYPPPAARMSAAAKAKQAAAATHDPQLNEVAAGLVTSLQLLLAHGHRDHYRQRSMPPPPTDSVPPKPTYYMLRCIVANLKYEKGIEHIASYLSDVCSILHGVGIDGSSFQLCETPISTSLLPSSAAKAHFQQQQQQLPSASESFCNAFLAPREFSFEYTITEQVRILVRCRTTVVPLKAQYLVQLLPPASLMPPVRVAPPAPLAPPAPPLPKSPFAAVFPPADNYGTLRDVLDYLSKATSHVLAAHALKLARRWESRSGLGVAWSTSVDGVEIVQPRNAHTRVRFDIVETSAVTALDTLVAQAEGHDDSSPPIESDEDGSADEREAPTDAEDDAQDAENARNVDTPMVRPRPPQLRVYASWPTKDPEAAVFRKWVWSATSLAQQKAAIKVINLDDSDDSDDSSDWNDLDSIVIGCLNGKLKPGLDGHLR